ncbi:hypothetical protein [Methyloceanibacter methanicus]|nr:hypothetical protein [Methyloceanibacter methanicus]
MIATPAIKMSVRRTASGKTFSMRCGQVSPLECKAMTAMANSGAAARRDRISAPADQPKLPVSSSLASRRRKGTGFEDGA